MGNVFNGWLSLTQCGFHCWMLWLNNLASSRLSITDLTHNWMDRPHIILDTFRAFTPLGWLPFLRCIYYGISWEVIAICLCVQVSFFMTLGVNAEAPSRKWSLEWCPPRFSLSVLLLGNNAFQSIVILIHDLKRFTQGKMVGRSGMNHKSQSPPSSLGSTARTNRTIKRVFLFVSTTYTTHTLLSLSYLKPLKLDVPLRSGSRDVKGCCQLCDWLPIVSPY